MGATWNRDVDIAAGACPGGSESEHLTVSVSANNGNPPDHPNDKANNITVNTADRSGANGAQIIYHAKTQGLTLTGIVAKEGSNLTGLSAEPRGNGETLVLSDTGGPGITYTYYVQGTYGGSSVQTCDPQIHNEDDG